MTLRVLDLFSGIGAYALGVERAGMKVVAFCENSEYPRKILRKHWPDVPIYDDVRTLNADALSRDGIAIDVIVGGWPCQDISVAGAGAGLDGARSGLWSEIARLAGELRPAYLILENSSNLLAIDGGDGFGRVLGDLAALGYDAEWHCLSAAAFDAPHIRDRLWIVAHRRGAVADANIGESGERFIADLQRRRASEAEQAGLGGERAPVPDVARHAGPEQPTPAGTERQRVGRGSEPARTPIAADADRERLAFDASVGSDACEKLAPAARSGGARGDDVADAGCDGRDPRRTGDAAQEPRGRQSDRGGEREPMAHPHGFPSFGAAIARRERHTWEPESGLDRVDVRASSTVDRIHALGNCNPPIIIQAIAEALIAAQTPR